MLLESIKRASRRSASASPSRTEAMPSRRIKAGHRWTVHRPFLRTAGSVSVNTRILQADLHNRNPMTISGMVGVILAIEAVISDGAVAVPVSGNLTGGRRSASSLNQRYRRGDCSGRCIMALACASDCREGSFEQNEAESCRLSGRSKIGVPAV